MESVIDGLNKLNLHPNQLISLQTLKQLVQHMEDNQTREIKFSDVIDFIHNVSKGSRASQNETQTPTSPMFTFQTPLKSFVFKKPLGKDENDHQNVLDDSDEGEETDNQPTSSIPTFPTTSAEPVKKSNIFGKLAKDYASQNPRKSANKPFDLGGSVQFNIGSSKTGTSRSNSSQNTNNPGINMHANIFASAASATAPAAAGGLFADIPLFGEAVDKAQKGSSMGFGKVAGGASGDEDDVEDDDDAEDIKIPTEGLDAHTNPEEDNDEMHVESPSQTQTTQPTKTYTPAAAPTAPTPPIFSTFIFPTPASGDPKDPTVTSTSTSNPVEALGEEFSAKISFTIGKPDTQPTQGKSRGGRRTAAAGGVGKKVPSPAKTGLGVNLEKSGVSTEKDSSAPNTNATNTPHTSGVYGEPAPEPEPAMRTSSSEDEGDAQTRPHTADSQDNNLTSLADLYCRQGKELYSIGLYDRALDAYTKCLNLAPSSWSPRATVLGNRAAVHFMMGSYIDCVNDCQDSLVLDSGLVKLHLRQAKALLKLAHYAEAQACFQRILDYVPLGSLPKDVVANMAADEQDKYKELVEHVQREARAGIREIVKLKEKVSAMISAENKRDYPSARLAAEEILSRSPHHYMARVCWSWSMVKNPDKAGSTSDVFQEVKVWIEQYAQSTPSNILALHSSLPLPPHTSGVKNPFAQLTPLEASKGLGEEIQGDMLIYAQAVLLLGAELGEVFYYVSIKNHALALTHSLPLLDKCLACLGFVQQASGMALGLEADAGAGGWGWVGKEMKKIKEVCILKRTGDVQYKAGQFRSAYQQYTLAIQADVSAPRILAVLYANRAACALQLGMCKESVQDCNQSLELEDTYLKALVRRARAFKQLDKPSDAIRDYRRYLSATPAPADAAAVRAELDELISRHTHQPSRGTSGSSRPSSSSGGGTSANTRASFSGNGGGGTSARGGSSKSLEEEYEELFESFKQAQGTSRFAPRSGNSNSSNPSGYNAHSNDNPRGRSAGASASSKGAKTYYTSAMGDLGVESDDDDYDEYEEKLFSQTHSTRNTGRSNAMPSPRGQTHTSSAHQTHTSSAHQAHSTHSAHARPSAGAGHAHTNASGAKTHTGASASASASANAGANASTSATHTFALTETDHYTILNVSVHASDKDIKLAYRRLALLFHPDKNKHPDAEERFKMISRAYNVLMDKATRREFDLTRPVARYRRY